MSIQRKRSGKPMRTTYKKQFTMVIAQSEFVPSLLSIWTLY